MRLRLLLGLVTAGLVACSAILALTLYRAHEDRVTMERLVKERDAVCTRLEWDLEGMVRNPQKRGDLRARIQYLHLDQGLAQLCLGNPIPVDTRAADDRWVLTHDESGYMDVAKALLELYRVRKRD